MNSNEPTTSCDGFNKKEKFDQEFLQKPLRLFRGRVTVFSMRSLLMNVFNGSIQRFCFLALDLRDQVAVHNRRDGRIVERIVRPPFELSDGQSVLLHVLVHGRRVFPSLLEIPRHV